MSPGSSSSGSKRSSQRSGSKSSSTAEASQGPASVVTRSRAEDAAEATREMAELVAKMDRDKLARLVRARETAHGIKDAFPGGDARFASMDSDEEEDDYDGGEDEEEEECVGLLDQKKDTGPRAALERVKKEYNWDMVKEMDEGKLSLLERVRVLNYVRKRVAQGVKTKDVVKEAKAVIRDGKSEIRKDERWLTPVVPGDVLLTALEGKNCGSDEDDDDDCAVADAVERELRACKISADGGSSRSGVGAASSTGKSNSRK